MDDVNAVYELSPDLDIIFKLNEQKPDVTLSLNGLQIKVHSEVLIKKSSYFHSLMTGKWKESGKKELTLNSANVNIFLSIVNFMYKGDIIVKDVDMGFELYNEARFYGLLKMMNICEEYIYEMISTNCKVKDFCNIWNMVDDIQSVYLDQACLEVFQENFSILMDTVEFATLKKCLLLKGLQSDYLSTPDEITVVRALIKWAKFNTDGSDIEMAEILKTMLPHIRYFFISGADLDILKKYMTNDFFYEARTARLQVRTARQFYVNS